MWVTLPRVSSRGLLTTVQTTATPTLAAGRFALFVVASVPISMIVFLLLLVAVMLVAAAAAVVLLALAVTALPRVVDWERGLKGVAVVRVLHQRPATRAEPVPGPSLSGVVRRDATTVEMVPTPHVAVACLAVPAEPAALGAAVVVAVV